MSEKFQWQVYYLGMGHYVKMNKEFVKNLVDELRSLFDEMKFVAMDKAQNCSKNDNI